MARSGLLLLVAHLAHSYVNYLISPEEALRESGPTNKDVCLQLRAHAQQAVGGSQQRAAYELLSQDHGSDIAYRVTNKFPAFPYWNYTVADLEVPEMVENSKAWARAAYDGDLWICVTVLGRAQYVPHPCARPLVPSSLLCYPTNWCPVRVARAHALRPWSVTST